MQSLRDELSTISNDTLAQVNGGFDLTGAVNAFDGNAANQAATETRESVANSSWFSAARGVGEVVDATNALRSKGVRVSPAINAIPTAGAAGAWVQNAARQITSWQPGMT